MYVLLPKPHQTAGHVFRLRGPSFGLSDLGAGFARKLAEARSISYAFFGPLRLTTYAPATAEGALLQCRLLAANKTGLSDTTGMGQPKAAKGANAVMIDVEARILILGFVSVFLLCTLLGAEAERKWGAQRFKLLI